MTQRKNTRDRIRWSHGTEQDENEAISESKTPEVNLSGGVYRASSPTYTDGDNAVMHFDVNGKLKTIASETIDGGAVVTVSGAAAGGLAVLGATGEGLKYRIFKISISSSAAETVTFSDGIGVQYVVAGGNVPVDFYPVGLLQGTANTAITATTAGACNLAVTVVYKKE